MKTALLVLMLTFASFAVAQDCQGNQCPCSEHNGHYNGTYIPPVASAITHHQGAGDHHLTVSSMTATCTFDDGPNPSGVPGSPWICRDWIATHVNNFVGSDTGTVDMINGNLPTQHRFVTGVLECGDSSSTGAISTGAYAVMGLEQCGSADGACSGATPNWPLPACGLPSSYTEHPGTTGVTLGHLELARTFTCPKLTSPFRGGSPIVIPLDGGNYQNAFSSFDAGDTVLFAKTTGQQPVAMSWIAAGAPYGFLVLDRNGNGTIDSLGELFGALTDQPADEYPIDPDVGAYVPTGFRALSVYDRAQYGGNGDGVITSADAIWSQLRVWEDTCHCGNSANGTMHTLTELGITELGLKAEKIGRADQFGNQFGYLGYVQQSGHHQNVYDVMFRTN